MDAAPSDISFIVYVDDPDMLDDLKERLAGDEEKVGRPFEIIEVGREGAPEIEAYREGFARSGGRFVNFCYASSSFTAGCIATFLDAATPGIMHFLRPYYVTPKKKVVSYYPRYTPEAIEEGKTPLEDDPFAFNICLGSYFIPRELVTDAFFVEGLTNECVLYGLIELLEGGARCRYLDEGRYYFRKALFDAYNYAEQHKPQWYTESVSDELGALLEAHPGSIRMQAIVFYLLTVRYMCNYNTRDDGILQGADLDRFIDATGKLLQGIDDEVVMTSCKFAAEHLPRFMRYYLLKFKYEYAGDPRETWARCTVGKMDMMFNGIVVAALSGFKVKVYAMNYVDGCLVIDARLTNSYCLDASKLAIYFTVGDRAWSAAGERVVYAEESRIYSLSTYFGTTVDRAYAFQVAIPEELLYDGAKIYAYIDYEGYRNLIPFKFVKIAARLSSKFSRSYWQFGPWLLDCPTPRKSNCYRLRVRRATLSNHLAAERKLLKTYLGDAYVNRSLRSAGGVAFRLLYWATRPLYVNKHVWFMFDQLFKGGDNAEYLFRYMMDNGYEKGVAPYYILNADAPEFGELRGKYGRHVSAFKSLHCRLLALNAEMIFATRADARLYCGIGPNLMKYVGDLFNGDVLCLQHGLTIQRIAQYQNRLFDNTRLYFLVSPLERENISHEIYGYTDDMLVMTGSPRYDGLVSDDRKQILITPTWRRSVTAGTNTKGENNEYSAYFKQTEYFRVYNRLINDEKLLAAARETGYKIIYLIHPILSPQIEDFQANDQVEIVAGSQVDYEQILSESSLMVTDYSGIQFDFAYMRKPVVYYHPHSLPPQYDSSVYDYETRALGPVYAHHDQLVEALAAYMRNGCQVEDAYLARINGFFAFDDRNNAARVYEESLRYMRAHFDRARTASSRETDSHQEKLAGIELRESRHVASFRQNAGIRESLKPHYENLLEEHGVELESLSPSAIDFYYDESFDPNAVLVVGLGTGVRGNMQYVLDELNHNERYAHLQIYVRAKDDAVKEVKKFIEQNGWERTHVLKGSYAKYLETCKYLITESYFPYQWIKRPGQVLIDTWHGTPLKKLGLVKSGRKAHRNAIQQKNFLCTDYFLYPNDFTRDVMRSSYKIASIMPGKELMLGYPRVAGMLKVSDERKAELRALLAPNGERLYAYMPTFRGYLSDADTIERERVLLDTVDGLLADDQLLYVNLHHHVGAALDFAPYRHVKPFPRLIDSYELLTVTDALISDYSSVFFDYLALGKQIILHIDDYETYRKRQGLNIEIDELPFDLARTAAEIVDYLNAGKGYDDTQIRSELCAYDAADNPEKICQLFVGDTRGLDVAMPPEDSRRKVLVYSQACPAGAATDMLKSLAGLLDAEGVAYWIGCDEYRVGKDSDAAYPLLHDAPALGSHDEFDLSSIGTALKRLYLDGSISFEEAMGLLVHEYGLWSRRAYGAVVFDVLAIYDTPNPEAILGLALSPAKRKLLFLQEPAFDALAAGDAFLADAVAFSSAYCHAVVVPHEAYVEVAELVVPTEFTDRIVVAGTAEAVKALIMQ